MYAFYVLDLPEDTTDEAVEARYQALVRQYPPDQHPQRFQQIRQAYETLKTPRGRVAEQLFYHDDRGMALTHDWLAWSEDRPRKRLSVAALSALVGADGA
jgi:curved DNA-binding protein CbpA